MTQSTSAPAALARRAGSSNQASSQIMTAEIEAADREGQRRQAGVAPGGEVAPFVEDLVVRELALAVGRDDATLAQNRGGVEAQRHRDRLRPNISRFTELMRMADDNEQPGKIGEPARAVGQRLGTGAHERGTKQQVLGRIAAQAEFGRQDDARPLLLGAARERDDLLGVCREVSDRRVDLRQRDPDRKDI